MAKSHRIFPRTGIALGATTSAFGAIAFSGARWALFAAEMILLLSTDLAVSIVRERTQVLNKWPEHTSIGVFPWGLGWLLLYKIKLFNSCSRVTVTPAGSVGSHRVVTPAMMHKVSMKRRQTPTAELRLKIGTPGGIEKNRGILVFRRKTIPPGGNQSPHACRQKTKRGGR